MKRLNYSPLGRKPFGIGPAASPAPLRGGATLKARRKIDFEIEGPERPSLVSSEIPLRFDDG